MERDIAGDKAAVGLGQQVGPVADGDVRVAEVDVKQRVECVRVLRGERERAGVAGRVGVEVIGTAADVARRHGDVGGDVDALHVEDGQAATGGCDGVVDVQVLGSGQLAGTAVGNTEGLEGEGVALANDLVAVAAAKVDRIERSEGDGDILG